MNREKLINILTLDYRNYAVDCFIYNYGDDWTSKELMDDVKGFKESLENYSDFELLELLNGK